MLPLVLTAELLPPDTGRAFRAMHELRPALASQEEFVARVDHVQRGEGYRLVAVLPDDGGDALAVAGFRLGTNLAWGRHLYVDDLSTRVDARRRGLASRLLTWVEDEATRLGCGEVHLDSGVGPHRATAHRLYLGRGYVISSNHFTRTL